MPAGKVKWYNDSKGYGFIQPADGGKDVFLHASAVAKANVGKLNEGDDVMFDIEQAPRGPKVTNLSRVSLSGDAP